MCSSEREQPILVSVERYFVGMTGASGHVYARRLIQALAARGARVDLSITAAGCKVLRHEEGVALDPGADATAALGSWLGEAAAQCVTFHAPEAVEAPPSSGTSGTRAAILCPCSMGTLARVAAGFSSNLVERAADVALKEGRSLVIVPRESPLSPIHLENLLHLARLGAVVLPAMPGFYHRPQTLGDLVDHVVGKILDRLGLEHEVGARWDGELAPGAEPEPLESEGVEHLRPRSAPSNPSPGGSA
jgi:4-hydroxy-3-polyprenylbenzoate decarboxylase